MNDFMMSSSHRAIVTGIPVWNGWYFVWCFTNEHESTGKVRLGGAAYQFNLSSFRIPFHAFMCHHELHCEERWTTSSPGVFCGCLCILQRTMFLLLVQEHVHKTG
jgi:hypothetical protein